MIAEFRRKFPQDNRLIPKLKFKIAIVLRAGNFFIKISLRVLGTCTYFSLYVERVLRELTQVRNLS